MTHRFTAPNEVELENLLGQVFESMPGADESRLLLIENRVLQTASRNSRRKNLHKTPWWIVLLFIGSVAAAAWWQTELADKKPVSDEGNRDNSEQTLKLRDNSDMNKNRPREHTAAEDTVQDRDSPVIYQRESF